MFLMYFIIQNIYFLDLTLRPPLEPLYFNNIGTHPPYQVLFEYKYSRQLSKTLKFQNPNVIKVVKQFIAKCNVTVNLGENVINILSCYFSKRICTLAYQTKYIYVEN